MRRWLWLHGYFLLGVVVQRWLSTTWTKVEGLIVRSLFLGEGERAGDGQRVCDVTIMAMMEMVGGC